MIQIIDTAKRDGLSFEFNGIQITPDKTIDENEKDQMPKIGDPIASIEAARKIISNDTKEKDYKLPHDYSDKSEK